MTLYMGIDLNRGKNTLIAEKPDENVVVMALPLC